MGTNYPGSLDSYSRPTSSTQMDASGFEGDVIIDNLYDAVEAIEAELGTTPKGSNVSVAARLGSLPRTLVPAVGESTASSWGQSSNFNVAALNEMWAIPFFCPIAMTIDRIYTSVYTAGGASQTLRLGVYGSTSDKPGSLIVDGGTVAANSTGAKSVTVSQALPAGLLWLVCAWQGSGAAAALYDIAGFSPRLPTPSGSTTVAETAAHGYWVSGVSGALPGTFGTPTASPYGPSLGVRRSA